MADLLLRPWQASDAAALLDIFAASDDLATQYPLPVTTLSEANKCLESMLPWDASHKNFAVVPLTGARGGPDAMPADSPVGNPVGSPFGNVAVTGVEFRHGTGWVSYFCSGAVRGRGYISRSVAALANWALDPDGLGLERLELGHRLNNPASGVVALRAGFVQEGTERAKLRYGDERFDVATYGRLRRDPVPNADAVALLFP